MEKVSNDERNYSSENETWEWLLEGFKFDLETQGKPKTVDYYYQNTRRFAQWANNTAQISNPQLISATFNPSYTTYSITLPVLP